MSTHNTWRLTGALGGLLLAATSAFSQGVFIDRFNNGNHLDSDKIPGYWSTLNQPWPCYAQELNGRLKLNAENNSLNVGGTQELTGLVAGPVGWTGNFLRSEKTYGVRGIWLDTASTAFVFALNSRQAPENDPSTPSDAITVRLDQLGNRIELKWKLNNAGEPNNTLVSQVMPAQVHAFVLKLSANSYTLNVIHKAGTQLFSGPLPASAGTDWDNGGDSALVLRCVRQAGNSTAATANVKVVDVGGASFVEPFSDTTPADIDTYLPAFWTASATAPSTVTETGGSLAVRAQTSGGTVTVGSSLVGDLTSLGNFTAWPKTYLINGINFTGDALAANRELVFALNDAEVADPASATDSLQLRLGANNSVKLGWKLNSAGSTYTWPLNVTLTAATSITGARLTIDGWRYSMVVTTVGGAGSYSFKGTFPLAPASPAWNPAQWNSVGGANNGKSSLLFRAERKPDVGNTFAQSAINALTIYEPGFSSDFEAATIEAEGWSVDGLAAGSTYDGQPGVSLVTTPRRSGNKAVMCRVHQQDPNISLGKRAEITRTHIGSQGLDRWYAFSVYLQNWQPSQHGEIIAQWIADPDSGEPAAKGPYLALGVANDVWFLESRWDSAFLSAGTQMNKTALWPTPPTVEKDQWIDFVVRIRWSAQSGGDGVIQLWKNGVPVALNTAAVGPNAYNDLNDIAMKLGIYRYTWNTNVPPGDVLQRVLYLDAVRTADKYSELNDLKMY